MLDGDGLKSMGAAGGLWWVMGTRRSIAALYCEELGTLISGDMVLPKISTNVSVWASEPEGDPLDLFFALSDTLPLSCPRKHSCYLLTDCRFTAYGLVQAALHEQPPAPLG
jgi:hypothetical protein